MIAAKIGVQYKTSVTMSNFSHTEADAKLLTWITLGDKKASDKRFPGLYDFFVATTLVGWSAGHTDPGDYLQASKDAGFGPELYHPMSFSHWLRTQCERTYPQSG